MKRTSIILAVIALFATLLFSFTRLGVLSSGDKVMSQKEANDANRIVYNDITENYTWICTQVTEGMDYLEHGGSISAHDNPHAAYAYLNDNFTTLSTAPAPDGTAKQPTAYTPEQWTSHIAQLQKLFGTTASDADAQSQQEQPEEIFDFLRDHNGALSDELNTIFDELPIKTEATQDRLRDGSCAQFMNDPDSDQVNKASVDLAAYTKKFSDQVGATADIFSKLSDEEVADTQTLRSNVLAGIDEARQSMQSIGRCTPATIEYGPTRTKSSKDACTQANAFTSDFLGALDDYSARFTASDQHIEQTFGDFSDTITELYNRVEGIVYDLNFALPAPNEATEDEINRKGYRQ